MDKPNFYQVDSYLTGLSLLTAIPPVAGQMWIQLKCTSGALAYICNGSSGQLLGNKGLPIGGATLPPIDIAGGATLFIMSVGASCEIGTLRGCVV